MRRFEVRLDSTQVVGLVADLEGDMGEAQAVRGRIRSIATDLESPTATPPSDQGTMVFVVADAAAVNIDCVSAFSFGPCIAVMPL